MKTELYRKVDFPSVQAAEELQKRKSRDEKIQKLNEEMQRVETLKKRFLNQGLHSQVKLLEENVSVLKRQIQKETGLNPAHFYPQITPEEMRIWEVWLPTRYIEEGERLPEYNFDSHFVPAIEKRLNEYDFDKIPECVLEEMECSQALNLFETLEIRTPEGERRTCPILIGWFDNIPYLIARWAESLRPFKEIKAIVEEGFKLRDKERRKDSLWGRIFVSNMIFWILSFFLLVFIARFLPEESEGLCIPLYLFLCLGSIVLLAAIGSRYNPDSHFNQFLREKRVSRATIG